MCSFEVCVFENVVNAGFSLVRPSRKECLFPVTLVWLPTRSRSVDKLQTKPHPLIKR